MSGLTKILIVLQLVFSLILSVLLVLMVSRQENYKDQLAAHNTGWLASEVTINRLNTEIAEINAKSAESLGAAQAALAAQAASANNLAAERARLTNDVQRGEQNLAAEKLQNAQLASAVQAANVTVEQQRKELNDVNGKLSPLIAQNGELGRKNAELETQVRMADTAIRKLQEELSAKPTAAAAAPSAATDLAPPSLSAISINGKITDTASSAGRTYIETALGSRDGLKENSRLAIYRGNTYVGDAVVQRVTADASVAVVTTLKSGEAIQKGDLVMVGD